MLQGKPVASTLQALALPYLHLTLLLNAVHRRVLPPPTLALPSMSATLLNSRAARQHRPHLGPSYFWPSLILARSCSMRCALTVLSAAAAEEGEPATEPDLARPDSRIGSPSCSMLPGGSGRLAAAAASSAATAAAAAAADCCSLAAAPSFTCVTPHVFECRTSLASYGIPLICCNLAGTPSFFSSNNHSS